MAKHIIITGASSGLGHAIYEALMSYHVSQYVTGEADEIPIIQDWSLNNGVDVTDEGSIMEAAATRIPDGDTVDILVNCAGVNHIDWFPMISSEDFDRLMNTNARAFLLVTQSVIGRLASGTILNIVSNASHMPMTHSIAYNASKGAAHIMTLQMARELKKTHGITVFGVSPNKLKGTGMSQYIDARVCELRGWTPEEAAAYQKQSLPAGEETDPVECAEFITYLLSKKKRHAALNGCILPYGA